MTTKPAVGGPWWQVGPLYQIYPRSYADSDGDGVGDLPGITARLDHLEWLGAAGLWLNPITPSPNRDWGYDVADYRGVHPDLGTLDDFDRLVREAAARGIRVMLDIVPSHTSDEHRWFVDARTSRTARRRDYYVWADPGPDGRPPNNWLSHFGGPAWTLDERTGQYYMHNFSPHQPQLNWWNPEVQREFDEIYRWWAARDAEGFRIDVCHGLFHDRLLRDNPPASSEATWKERELGQRFQFNMNRPEGHEVIRRWRRLADGHDPPLVLFGETWVGSLTQLAEYYGDGTTELHLAWNLPFLNTPFDADGLADVISETVHVLPERAWPCWAMSTHDAEGRATTRWARGDARRHRCALMVLLLLRGTPIVYYGDEIGMPNVEVTGGRDVANSGYSRDASRTPMQWSAEQGAGFTRPGVEPWLPLGDHAAVNVADQRGDPASTLNLCRDLIALRRSEPELALGDMEFVARGPQLLAWRRGGFLVAVNPSDDAASLGVAGAADVVLATERGREGERVRDELNLEPASGIVCRLER